MPNTWIEKIKRTITALLPVDRKRAGSCLRCGNCCKLPNLCLFLRYDQKGKAKCLIYTLRPLNCRKYPRTEKECLTFDTCGFNFKK